MVARRQLRHDTAIFGVHLHLAVQAMGQQPGPAVVHGRGGLVAGGFDAQNSHFVRSLKLAYVL